jgi:hypothetical protein
MIAGHDYLEGRIEFKKTRIYMPGSNPFLPSELLCLSLALIVALAIMSVIVSGIYTVKPWRISKPA